MWSFRLPATSSSFGCTNSDRAKPVNVDGIEISSLAMDDDSLFALGEALENFGLLDLGKAELVKLR